MRQFKFVYYAKNENLEWLWPRQGNAWIYLLGHNERHNSTITCNVFPQLCFLLESDTCCQFKDNLTAFEQCHFCCLMLLLHITVSSIYLTCPEKEGKNNKTTLCKFFCSGDSKNHVTFLSFGKLWIYITNYSLEL